MTSGAALGVKNLPMPEFEDWIVFMKGDQITSLDKRRYNPERPFDQTVFLDFNGTREKWKIFRRDQDLFEVVLHSSSGRDNILLRSVASAGTSSPRQE